MGRRWRIGRRRSAEAEVREPEVREPEAAGKDGDDAAADAPESTAAATMRATADRLHTVIGESQEEIGRLAGEFEAMAASTQAMLESAAVIVACSEGEPVQSVLSGVRSLGEATGIFLHQRLDATTAIVETVKEEAALLARLAQQTGAQKAIVRETAMLRLLTNIEVARLGEVGAGFEYLARELDDFATAVSESIAALSEHTEQRQAEIEGTRRTLTAELPRMREEYAGLETTLSRAQAQMETTLAQLQATPARFQSGVTEIAQQIAGVVAAIQANDITRQQMEHVAEALRAMAGDVEASGNSTEVAAGLAIQSYQVRSLQATAEGWTGQIRGCLEAIAQVAASEILETGRSVLGREREVEAELARIEQLEEQCAADNARVEASFAGIAGLMQLVSEHLQRSHAVRERLQLLMFNSIVEASHLGAQADGILEISNTIKRLSGEWSAITQQSEEAMRAMRGLVEQSRTAMEAFSGEARQRLRAAREEARAGLASLCDAANCAQGRGEQIQTEAGALQGHVAQVRAAGERLERSLAPLGEVLAAIEAARAGGEAGARPWDAAAMEARFGSAYTTEIERAVLRAALEGGPLPAAEAHFAGNAVELF